MKKCFFLFLLLALQILFGGTNAKVVAQLRFSSIDEEAVFFGRINDYRYQGYPYTGDEDHLIPMGYLMCYRSDSFLNKSQNELMRLGLDSFESCVTGPSSDEIYEGYIKCLRNFIDNSQYLHSDKDFPYALTNARGIALFDIELLMTELILYKYRSIMTASELGKLVDYHALIMNCFRFWFTMSYLDRGICQMSGLTGDTYRACWPYLKLYNIVLNQCLIEKDNKKLFKLYEVITHIISFNDTITKNSYNRSYLDSIGAINYSDEEYNLRIHTFCALWSLRDIQFESIVEFFDY